MTTIYDFDRLVDRSDTGSIKWEKYRGRDVLPMWVADSDFEVVPEIRQALQRRVEHGVYGYTSVSNRLIELIVERVGNRYGWDIDDRWIVPLPNVITSFYLVCRAHGKAGDPVYVPAVIYPPVSIAPGYYSMTSQPIPMAMRDERMLVDLDWLERQSADSGRLMIFCNPQNPGGTVYRRDELEQLAEIAVRKDLVILSDEVHCDLLLDEDRPHIPIASLNPGIAGRSVTLISPSKTFNTAGLGCAFAIIPDRKLRTRMKTNPYIVPHVNLLGLTAAEAAYRHGEEWNRQQCAYLAANRDYLLDEINRIPGLRLGPIEATYLAWIEVAALGLDDPPRFFEDAGVGMSPGRDFGDAGFMRLNFGCPRSRVEQAVERIRSAVEGPGHDE
ncbi:MAG: PatB family C-S lyase [Gammaproteobacteria bacterium]|jgi:cystathionine beta-lyase